MDVTDSANERLDNTVQPSNIEVVRLVVFTVADVRLVQLWNILVPTVVMVAGSVTDVIFVEANAEAPMLVTVDGILNTANLVFWNALVSIFVNWLVKFLLASNAEYVTVNDVALYDAALEAVL